MAATQVKELPDISVFVITRDDSKTIKRCLKQLVKFATEVIVIDYGSEDSTLRIAEKYANKIFTKQWCGVYQMKKFALSLCNYSWVMHVCADEVVTDRAIDDMKKKIGKQLANNKVGFSFPRRFHIGNTFIRWGGFYPDKQLRLFKKNIAHFRGLCMDESVEVWDTKKERYLTQSSSIYALGEDIYYYPFKDIKEMEDYHFFNAEVGFQKISFFAAVVGAYGCFIERFIFRLGFLGGGLGFKIAKIKAMSIWKQYKRASDPNSAITKFH